MLDQRQRRWADAVQMLYKCFVFAAIGTALKSQKAVGYIRCCLLAFHGSIGPL